MNIHTEEEPFPPTLYNFPTSFHHIRAVPFLKEKLRCSELKIFRYKQQLLCFWSVYKHWKPFPAQHTGLKKFVLVFGYMFKHKPTSS